MNIRVECDERNCSDEADHGFCHRHFEDVVETAVEQAFERGKKEGYDEGFEAAKDEIETNNRNSESQ